MPVCWVGEQLVERWGSIGESDLHINCLELISGSFAICFFAKDKTHCCILLRTDITAVQLGPLCFPLELSTPVIFQLTPGPRHHCHGCVYSDSGLPFIHADPLHLSSGSSSQDIPDGNHTPLERPTLVSNSSGNAPPGSPSSPLKPSHPRDSMNRPHPLTLQHRLPLLVWSGTGLPDLSETYQAKLHPTWESLGLRH